MKKTVIIPFVCLAACQLPKAVQVNNKQVLPSSYNTSHDTINTAKLNYKQFFTDQFLVNLIDTALKNNYELLASAQDIEIAKNYIRIKHADLLPTINAAAGLGIEKTGRYTAQGAGNASTKMEGDKEVPEPIGDIFLGFKAGWEIDIWGKLHKAKKAAVIKYLQTIEGKNFITTNLVAEIANAYYELLALDNQLAIVNEAIDLQKKQLDILKIQKEAAAATELAVKQFEAQVYSSLAKQYDILQSITETENNINYLLGRFPQPIARDKNTFSAAVSTAIQSGIPAQLLVNRPDIKQAEYEVQAAKLEVQIARAEFLPSVGITGLLGFNGYQPKYVLPTVENLAFKLAGDMVAPLINRNAIVANFKNANASQINALYEYQKTILSSYIEVYNQMSAIKNLEKYYTLKNQQAQTLNKSITVANELFQYARANYLEVLTVQRDALDAKLELVEAKKKQLIATTNLYKALGGGWR